MVRCLLFALFAGLVGCQNPCQSLCDDMASYAVECGYDVSSDQIQECRDANATSSITQARAQECIDQSDPDVLREWWTCDDVARNFTDATK